MKLILSYLLIINAVSFCFMLVDKRRARKNRWRIPEARLMGLAVLGGSPGILAGMYLLRHKTLHPKFTFGVPVILAIQAVAAAVLFSLI